MIKKKLILLFIMITFAGSIISSSTVMSANFNQSQTTSNNLITNTNQTGNITNQTMDNQTETALISNLTQETNELNVLSNESNESTIAEYSGQKLQELKMDVSNSSSMSLKTKKRLIMNINQLLQVNNATVTSIVNGNEAQAKSELQYEHQMLNEINTEINNENGKTINATDASNLNQVINDIKAGQENGEEWIVQNNPNLQITETTAYYSTLENKLDEIRSTIKKLKQGGVSVELKTMDINELNQIQNGQNGTSNNTKMGSTQVHAVIPIAVIVVAGSYITVNALAMTYIETNAEIDEIQEKTGKTVDSDCRNRMYLINFASIELASVATLGIGLYDIEGITLAELGLEIIDHQEFIRLIPEEALMDFLQATDTQLSDGCTDENCPFFRGNKRDLFVSWNLPSEVDLGYATTINAVVSNDKYGDTGPFNVDLYVANSSQAPMQYQLVSTQRVDKLKGKSNTTVLDWSPVLRGKNLLKVVVDNDNEVNETNENNNVAEGSTTALAVDRMTLYATKKIYSTKDPTQIAHITYYFRADHPLKLDPDNEMPIFVYKTTTPEYSDVGTLPFYPYGSIWQYYSNSSDVNGTWSPCYYNPYVTCSAGTTDYRVNHWAMGKGSYQYFAVTMENQPGAFNDGVLKTFLQDFKAIEE